MSLMTGKSLAVGEGGMLVTNDPEIYERAMAFGHYERFTDAVETESLRPYAGLPLGGYKYRMHQMSAAMGRVQLARYDERCAEIRRAMNDFWDRLEGVPGLRAHRVDERTGSNMAGWYAPHGLYRPEELGGLSVTRFSQAVRAEGFECYPGCNNALHTHGLFQICDVYGEGKPTRLARAGRDVRALDRDLPVSERVGGERIPSPGSNTTGRSSSRSTPRPSARRRLITGSCCPATPAIRRAWAAGIFSVINHRDPWSFERSRNHVQNWNHRHRKQPRHGFCQKDEPSGRGHREAGLSRRPGNHGLRPRPGDGPARHGGGRRPACAQTPDDFLGKVDA
jgi:hypothetical protein